MADGSFASSTMPELRQPVLVCSFRGWNDGGQGASLAGAFLARAWATERFADIDPELFFDFQSTRPHVSLADGATRRIDWPENAFHSRRSSRAAPATSCCCSGPSRASAGGPSASLVSGLATDLEV